MEGQQSRLSFCRGHLLTWPHFAPCTALLAAPGDTKGRPPRPKRKVDPPRYSSAPPTVRHPHPVRAMRFRVMAGLVTLRRAGTAAPTPPSLSGLTRVGGLP